MQTRPCPICGQLTQTAQAHGYCPICRDKARAWAVKRLRIFRRTGEDIGLFALSKPDSPKFTDERMPWPDWYFKQVTLPRWHSSLSF